MVRLQVRLNLLIFLRLGYGAAAWPQFPYVCLSYTNHLRYFSVLRCIVVATDCIVVHVVAAAELSIVWSCIRAEFHLLPALSTASLAIRIIDSWYAAILCEMQREHAP